MPYRPLSNFSSAQSPAQLFSCSPLSRSAGGGGVEWDILGHVGTFHVAFSVFSASFFQKGSSENRSILCNCVQSQRRKFGFVYNPLPNLYLLATCLNSTPLSPPGMRSGRRKSLRSS